MADWGIIEALNGKDALDVLLKELAFYSKYPLLKIKEMDSGSLTLHVDGLFTDIPICTHNLGYNPLYVVRMRYFDCFTSLVTTDYFRVPKFENSSGLVLYHVYIPYTNTTQLRLLIEAADGGGARDVTCYYDYIVYYDEDA